LETDSFSLDTAKQYSKLQIKQIEKIEKSLVIKECKGLGGGAFEYLIIVHRDW